MDEITLKSSKPFRDYTKPGGDYLYNLDKRVITHILKTGNRRKGHLEFIVSEVGTSGYTQIQIFYDGKLVYMAQETSSGDWWVGWCSIKDKSTLWDFIMT
jgi:hypothetical protein